MNNVINEILTRSDKLVKIIASAPICGDYKKVVLRKIEGGRWLVERYTENKVFHLTFEGAELEKCLKTHVIGSFKQNDIQFTDGAMTVLISKKGSVSVKKRGTQTVMQAVHNRKKKYLLEEGEDIPAMKDLGIFTKENKVAAQMQDKYRQINRFIETVDDALSDVTGDITVLDFGCGKSYLTFLLYYYLTVKKCLKTHVIGYDLKEDVVEKCNKIAAKYGYTGLEFVRADVKRDVLYDRDIDMIITLHACDTATDYALDYAIKKKAKYIFSVPCCQHELAGQIRRGGDFDIMLSHGLIKERFCALLTDAVRVEALENAGYRVDCLEFVGIDASPKNLMIRAVRTHKRQGGNGDIATLLKKYNANQTLLQLQEKATHLDEQEVNNG